MAKILLVLTIILTGAAAFFGYSTYTKLGDVSTTVAKYKSDAKDAGDKLAKVKADAETAKKDVAAANEKAAAATAADTADKAAADKATSDLAALKTSTDTQIADLNKTIDDLKKNATPGGPAQPQVAPADPKEITDLKAQLAEAKALNDTLQQKQKDDEGKIATLTAKANGVAIIKARPGLEGEIMAVNQGWNFVVVSFGDRQGATANSQLIVKRGDTMIAKLRITSVEPSTSIADIIPESVSKGQRVMPGDRVIFPVQ